MNDVPDAPYIREAENRGVDYMYEFCGYDAADDSDNDNDE